MEPNEADKILEKLEAIEMYVSVAEPQIKLLQKNRDKNFELTESMKDFFKTLSLDVFTLSDFLPSLNDYLIKEKCVKKDLTIHPNEYLRNVLSLPDESITYINLICSIEQHIKIDRLPLY